MAITHKRASDLDGAAACGVNVGKDWQTGQRKVYTYRGRFISFAPEGQAPTCRKCSGNVRRATVEPITEDYTGKIFHRSFGYDMTLNVYAKVIRHTAKGLLCQECHTITNGQAYGPRGTGKAWAGDIDTDKKPFVMLCKRSTWGSVGFTGQGNHWSLWDGVPDYENHCD